MSKRDRIPEALEPANPEKVNKKPTLRKQRELQELKDVRARMGSAIQRAVDSGYMDKSLFREYPGRAPDGHAWPHDPEEVRTWKSSIPSVLGIDEDVFYPHGNGMTFMRTSVRDFLREKWREDNGL